MGGKKACWGAAVLLVVLLAPGTSRAGPFFGDWGWCWKEGKDCPCGEYCCLHYWVPMAYWVKYCVHPAHLDQYPPGLPVPTSWQLNPYRCRAVPPMPMDVYADPAGYYGRAIVPPEDCAERDERDKMTASPQAAKARGEPAARPSVLFHGMSITAG